MKTGFQWIASQVILIWGLTDWVIFWLSEQFSNTKSTDSTHSVMFSFMDDIFPFLSLIKVQDRMEETSI